MPCSAPCATALSRSSATKCSAVTQRAATERHAARANAADARAAARRADAAERRAQAAVDSLRGDGLDVALVHVATPGQLDPDFIDALAQQPWIVTVEDHSIRTGLGACLAEALFSRGHVLPHLRLGVTEYAPSGSAEEVYAAMGIDVPGITESVRSFAGNPVPSR